jgi:hypothetical protein
VSNIETDMQLVSAGFCPCEDRVGEARACVCVPRNCWTIFNEIWYANEGFVLVSAVPQHFTFEERAAFGFEKACC